MCEKKYICRYNLGLLLCHGKSLPTQYDSMKQECLYCCRTRSFATCVEVVCFVGMVPSPQTLLTLLLCGTQAYTRRFVTKYHCLVCFHEIYHCLIFFTICCAIINSMSSGSGFQFDPAGRFSCDKCIWYTSNGYYSLVSQLTWLSSEPSLTYHGRCTSQTSNPATPPHCSNPYPLVPPCTALDVIVFYCANTLHPPLLLSHHPAHLTWTKCVLQSQQRPSPPSLGQPSLSP